MKGKERRKNDRATIERREITDKTLSDNRDRNDERTKERREVNDKTLSDNRDRNDETTRERRDEADEKKNNRGILALLIGIVIVLGGIIIFNFI